MARPPARGRPAAAKAPLQRGDRLRPGPLYGAVAREHNQLWLARKGLPPAASVAAPWQGGCRPQRATAAYAGQRRRRRRKGGKRARASF
ncbi:hypothetical protein BHE74_00049950 [Ensete ventricosum]|nr:hypothetical protein BHE74_00049950 [Ensete ventricosum]